MLSATAPVEVPVIAGFHAKPEYAGTIHDDELAKVYGYRGALVPGIILYGYMANPVVNTWGMNWVRRGTMQSHSRRPVYEGDRVVITAQPVREDEFGLSVEMEMHDGEGNLMATGRATLPNADPEMPDLADFPVEPIKEPLRPIEPGGFKAGDRFASKGATMDAADLRESLDLFGQSWPTYEQEGIIHPSQFPRVATHNALSSYALPTPSIYVSAMTQHLGVAHVGEEMTSSGYVVQAYERKGNHYTDQRHVIFAAGRPVALVLRTSIYAARKAR